MTITAKKLRDGNEKPKTLKASWLDKIIGKKNKSEMIDTFIVLAQNLLVNILFTKENGEQVINQDFIFLWNTSIKNIFTQEDDYQWISSGINIRIAEDKQKHIELPNKVLYELKEQVRNLANLKQGTVKKVAWKSPKSLDRMVTFVDPIREAVREINAENRYPLDLFKLIVSFYVLFRLNKSNITKNYHSIILSILMKISRKHEAFEKLHAVIVTTFRTAFAMTKNGEPFPETELSEEMIQYIKKIQSQREKIEKQLFECTKKQKGGNMLTSGFYSIGVATTGILKFLCFCFFIFAFYKYLEGHPNYPKYIKLMLKSCGGFIVSNTGTNMIQQLYPSVISVSS